MNNMELAKSLMDWFQATAWIVAAVGGIIAAFKAIVEIRKSTAQREDDLRWKQTELRWKQADMAKKCIDEIAGRHLARCAMRMLDWSGRTYDYEGKKTESITSEAMLYALRTSGTVFKPGSDEQFVRDSFDEFFDGLERLELFIRIDLIRFEDVESAFKYYVSRMAKSPVREVMAAFLNQYNFELAEAFVNRFPAWAQLLSAKSAAH